MKRILKIFFKSVLTLILGLVGYLISAVIGTLIPTTGLEKPERGEIKIYVRSNGLHTNLILPLALPNFEWFYQNTNKISKKPHAYRYLSIGWGDKAFYTQYKYQNLPGLYNTIRAMAWPSESAVHMVFLDQAPPENDYCLPLLINKNQFRKLLEYIDAYLIDSAEGSYALIGPGYGLRDYFLKSKGGYHLFFTCNNWVNQALKRIGIPTGIWIPLEAGIRYRLHLYKRRYSS